jgi:biotin transport system permease protein
MLKSLFVEGDTRLHRMNVKLKLGLLLILGIALYATDLIEVQAAAALVTALVYFSLGMGWREALVRLRPVLLTIAFLGLFNAYIQSPIDSLTSTLRLLAILFLTGAITATTRISAFMDAVTDLLMPFERMGLIKAADVSLALGLVLRFLPEISGHYQALKDAHQARGIPVETRTMIAPLIILALKDADTIAEAIDARGIRSH